MADHKIAKTQVADRRNLSASVGKVALMIGQLGTGGAEKQLVMLARGLRDHGIDTSVWTLTPGGTWEDMLRRERIPVIDMGIHGLRRARSTVPSATKFGRTVWTVRRDPPEVLHAFLWAAYVIAAPVARIARIPVLVAGRRSLGNFKDGHLMRVVAERWANRATDLLIANADAVAEDTKRRECVRDGKIITIYNGLPEEAFVEVSPALVDSTKPVVLCVANLLGYKGHRHLLEALSRLQRKGRPCTLLLAGEGRERRALEFQAARLSIDVRFLGTCPDVRPYLARAAVVAHPSDEEGMSNAVMEAMAAGRPVVATAVGGTPELLAGRGLLVPPADPAALADGIERLLDDPSLASQLAESAQQWSRQNLSAEAMVDRHIQAYSELLGRQCAG